MPPPDPLIIDALIAILRPLKGTGEPYWTNDPDLPEENDQVGPDEPIRTTIRAALTALNVYGQGGCPLCCS